MKEVANVETALVVGKVPKEKLDTVVPVFLINWTKLIFG